MEKIYMCIDLKTFYASVECAARGLDPFKTNLVVANPSHGRGAICLAISPKMKEQGVHNRCRIFDIPLTIDYITALPRMKLYMEYAAEIYGIYLKYISKDDIYVYSIDEVFLDASDYMKLYNIDIIELAKRMLKDVYQTTGITATVGIGTNLYLAKVALDIMAKHTADKIAYLDEDLYKEQLWHHQPLTDFWQVGRGIAKRLENYGIMNMQDIARFPERILYKEFGVNAEYLIDHASGIEPTTIADIKAYKPRGNSMSNGQILSEDYCYDEAFLALKEMVELNVLNLVENHVVTNHISLYVGYSKDIVKSTGGSRKISVTTNSYKLLQKEFLALFQETTRRGYPIRRLNISFGNLKDECYEAYDLFTDMAELQGERQLQCAILDIKNRFGKNAVLKGMNLSDKATTIRRNTLIGGHNAE